MYFSIRFARPENISLKLCIYSASKKINLWAVKLIRNIVGLGCQPVLLLNVLENWSTSILCFPGMCRRIVFKKPQPYFFFFFFSLHFLDLISLIINICNYCGAVWRSSSMLIDSTTTEAVNAQKNSLKYINIYSSMFCPRSYWSVMLISYAPKKTHWHLLIILCRLLW